MAEIHENAAIKILQSVALAAFGPVPDGAGDRAAPRQLPLGKRGAAH